MSSTMRTPRGPLGLGLAGFLAACGGGTTPAPVPRTPVPGAPTPEPQPTVVQRTLAPLPAPGTGGAGVLARHGGMIRESGEAFVELAATAKEVRVYILDAEGRTRPAAGTTGTITVTDGEDPAKAASPGATPAPSPAPALVLKLVPAGDDPEALRSEASLPPLFTAKVDLKTATGETLSATIPWARLGEPGKWTEPRPAPAMSPAVSPAAATPATR